MKQTEKSKFRQSATWKKFRKEIAENQNNIDFITLKKLIAGYNCHHLDLKEENYKNLDKYRFVCLNKNTHKMLHWLYTYYRKDPGILHRLEYFLGLMKMYSGE